MTALSVNYSVSIKADVLDKYENATVHISRSETYDVSGLTAEEADQLWNERYAALQEELGEEIAAKYELLHKGEI